MSRLVYGLLSDSRYAYRPRALDDALSQDVLKRYLETLDPGKVFLTAQDVASFNRYATTLDDAIKSGQVEPGWAIFALYRQRVDQRIGHARKVLKGEFDFSANERYDFDREDARTMVERHFGAIPRGTGVPPCPTCRSRRPTVDPSVRWWQTT